MEGSEISQIGKYLSCTSKYCHVISCIDKYYHVLQCNIMHFYVRISEALSSD